MSRLLKLLEIIPTDEYITSDKLSQILNVSSKTIRNDIIALNRFFNEQGAEIISKPRYGFYLKIIDLEKYHKYKNQLQQEIQKNNSDSKDRVLQIIEYLITTSSYICIDDLCDMIFASRSTLQADLKQVKKIIEKYDLNYEYKSGKGIRIYGDEKCLRLCLTRIKLESYSQIYDESTINKITTILERIVKEFDFNISEHSFNNLVVHIYISVERIKNGYCIVMDQSLIDSLENDEDKTMTMKLVRLIEESFNIVFSKSEIYYILMHLGGKKMIELGSEKGTNTIITEDVYKMVLKMLKVVNETFKIDFSYDLELITLLALHLVPFTHRINYGLYSTNPLLYNIRSHYALAYNIASIACNVLYEEYNKKISMDEIAYIALHFNVALERKRTKNKLNVLIVCSTGRGTAELLTYQVKERFENSLNVVKTTSAFMVDDIDFSNIDFILTTIPIKSKVPVPIIELRLFLDEAHVFEVNKFIVNKQNEAILEYFKEGLFFGNLNYNHKDDILKFLCDKAIEKYNLDKSFYNAVLEREMIGNTSFGNLISIPHPNKPIGNDSFVVIGVLNKPIDWDDEQVQLVFLLSMKESGDFNLQDFYKVLSKLLYTPIYVNRLINNPTFKELKTIVYELNSK